MVGVCSSSAPRSTVPTRALPAEVERSIQEIAAEARKALPVQRVILFGSRARGAITRLRSNSTVG